MNPLGDTPEQAAIRRLTSDLILSVAAKAPVMAKKVGLKDRPLPVSWLRDVEAALNERLAAYYIRD